MIPAVKPVLKIPPIASQELKVTARAIINIQK
jgi:hypothetical protein